MGEDEAHFVPEDVGKHSQTVFSSLRDTFEVKSVKVAAKPSTRSQRFQSILF